MAPAHINVNNADINPSGDSMDTMPLDVMGLFFFAYRDFVGDGMLIDCLRWRGFKFELLRLSN